MTASRSLTARALILLACALPPAAALAADDVLPLLYDFSVTNCTGAKVYNTFYTSTGTPDVSVVVFDTGTAMVSGLRLGLTPYVGTILARPYTRLLMHMDGNALDDSNFAHNGVATGLATVGSTGSLNTAYHWNSDGDNIHIAPTAYTEVGPEFTIQTWIYPTDVATSRPIFEWNEPDGDLIGVHLWLGTPGGGAPGSLYANIVDTNSQNHIFASSTSVVKQNQWQLVTLTMTGQYKATIYLDDVWVASRTLTGINGQLLANNMDIYIGCRPGAGAISFRGYMDELRMLNKAITEIDVMGDFHGSRLLYGENPSGPYLSRDLLSGDFVPAAADGDTSPRTLTLPGLYLGTSNYLRLLFQDRAGNTSYVAGALAFDTRAPAAPTGLTGAAQSDSAITWNWIEPTRLCYSSISPVTRGYYQIVDPDNGDFEVRPVEYWPSLSWTETGLTPNKLYRRFIRSKDAFGATPGGITSAYTWARAPTGAAVSGITTDSLTVTWGKDGNPDYTRYEVTLWSENFGVAIATPVAFSDNLTADTKVLSGLSPGTTYYIKVRARNSRSSAPQLETQSSGYTTAVAPTVPAGAQPPLPVSNGPSSITWSWPPVASAQEYILESSTTGLILARTAAPSFTSTVLSVNARYGARLSVVNQSGTGAPSGWAYGYTDANIPDNSAISNISSGSFTLSWTDNGNPDPTTYDVHLASDQAFGGTVNARATAARSMNLTGLLPGTTYYVKVRAISYNSRATGYDDVQWARTTTLGSITSTQTATSPYIPAAGTAGLWHFDQSSGTTSSDASGYLNHGTMGCLTTGCTSTPTYAAGISGLGRALSFTGLGGNPFFSAPDSNSLDKTGAFTVEAWVNPGDVSYLSETTILSKGMRNAENYALEILANKWNFKVRNGGATDSVSSTQNVRMGWTHLAGVYDAGANAFRIYVDGVRSNYKTTTLNPPGANGEELTIGVRKTAPGAYGYPFKGLIDEVHVVGRALSADEVRSDYDSSRPSILNAPAPSEVRLTLPPDAFSGAATVLFSTDPVDHGLLIDRQTANDALSSPPTGQTLVPGSFTEIVVTKDGFPFIGALGSSVAISLTYPDADNNTLVDGTNPPLPAQNLKIYTLDTSVIRWDELPSSVDVQAKRVTGLTSHFSIFALFGPSGIMADTKDVYAYPVPWKPDSGGAFDSATYAGRTGLAISNLSASGTVRIFTLSGELVADLSFGPTDIGTIIWNGKNHAGRNVASGVYFAYIKGGDGSTKIVKFAVER